MNGADFIGLIRALQAHLIRPLHSQGHAVLLNLSTANCVRRELAFKPYGAGFFLKDLKSTRRFWTFVITPVSRYLSSQGSFYLFIFFPPARSRIRTEDFPPWYRINRKERSWSWQIRALGRLEQEANGTYMPFWSKCSISIKVERCSNHSSAVRIDVLGINLSNGKRGISGNPIYITEIISWFAGNAMKNQNEKRLVSVKRLTRRFDFLYISDATLVPRGKRVAILLVLLLFL